MNIRTPSQQICHGIALLLLALTVVSTSHAQRAGFPNAASDLRTDTPDDPGFDCDEPDDEDYEFGSPAFPGCDPNNPTNSSVYQEHFSLFGFAPNGTAQTATYKDVDRFGQGQISGSSVDGAWKLTLGDPRVTIAVTDTGMRWNDRRLRTQIWLNPGELPMPEAGPNPADALFGGYDVDGNGQFDVDDYAGDSRVNPDAGPRGIAGELDGQDILRAFSDGVDDDGNGYIDDIVGWDFFEDDNDPDDTTSYSSAGDHGRGRAREAAEITNDGDGEAGVCPRCKIMPLRIWDTFVVPGDQWAIATVFAADHGVQVEVTANGSLQNTPSARAANRYAYERGMALMHVSSDLNTANHNYPTNYIESIYVNGCISDQHTAVGSEFGGGGQGVSAPDPIQTWFRNSNLTQYGAHSHVCWSAVTGSEATGHAGGAAGMVISAGLDIPPAQGGPLSANEVKQLLTLTAEDVLPENTAGAGTPDPAQVGWDEYFGYGRVQLQSAVAAVQAGEIPPEALIEGPVWWSLLNPETQDTVSLRGTVAARRSSACTYSLEWAVGIEPADDGFTSLVTDQPCPSAADAELAQLPLQTIADAVGAHARTGAVPAATPGAPNPVQPVTSRQLSNRADPNAHMFSVRLRVRDADGRVGEDRRVYLALNDPSAHTGWPIFTDTGGESSPLLYDLDGDGTLEIIEADSAGALCARSHDGTLSPAFNGGACWQLPPTYFHHPDAPAFLSGSVPPVTAGLRSPAAADLNRDFLPELVVPAADGRVFVLNLDGETLLSLGVDPANSTPDKRNDVDHPKRGLLGSAALADIDLDGRIEIIVAALDGFLYVWKGDDGSVQPGFPLEVRADVSSGELQARGELIYTPAVANLDGDPQLEIVTGSSDVISDDPAPPSSPPPVTGGSGAIAQWFLENSGAAGRTRVYAYDTDGSLLSGWPVSMTGLLPDILPFVGPQHGVAVADFDEDGIDEVIASMTTGDVVRISADGSLSSFPSEGAINGGASSEPAKILNLFEASVIGDLDGAGGLDVVHQGISISGAVNLIAVGQNQPQNHVIQAWDGGDAPRYLTGFPTAHDDFGLLSQPIVADVNGDGVNDVVAGSGLYLVQAYDGSTGMPVDGFPKQTGGWLYAVPAVGDVDGDGFLNLVGGSREGWRFVWDLAAAATPATNSQWWTESHDEHRSNRYQTDARPPSRVQQLRHANGTLGFLAAGDDWKVGAAAHYEVRTLDRPILNAEDWAAAVSLPMISGGVLAGTRIEAPLPAADSLGHVAVVAVDDVGQRAAPVSLEVPNPNAPPPPPAPVARLQVVAPTPVQTRGTEGNQVAAGGFVLNNTGEAELQVQGVRVRLEDPSLFSEALLVDANGVRQGLITNLGADFILPLDQPLSLDPDESFSYSLFVRFVNPEAESVAVSAGWMPVSAAWAVGGDVSGQPEPLAWGVCLLVAMSALLWLAAVRRRRWVAAAVVSVLWLGACRDAGSPSESDPPPPEVETRDFSSRVELTGLSVQSAESGVRTEGVPVLLATVTVERPVR